MDATPSAASVYYSVASSATSGSPVFHTPTTALYHSDAETTPRPTIMHSSLTLQRILSEQGETTGSSPAPLLNRYITNVSYTTRSGSVTPIPSSANMPISTRLRKRRRASQSSAAALSSPIRAMSPSNNARASAPISAPTSSASTQRRTSTRPSSPLIRSNMLRDISPHSSSYATGLQNAVDQVIASLMQRGRIREGHGMRELYLQSFKDPGTAHLLDSLLRLRASERQIWDFDRFVEYVNKLGEQIPVVVIETPLKAKLAKESSPSEAKEDEGGQFLAMNGVETEHEDLGDSTMLDGNNSSEETHRGEKDAVLVAAHNPQVVVEITPAPASQAETTDSRPPELEAGLRLSPNHVSQAPSGHPTPQELRLERQIDKGNTGKGHGQELSKLSRFAREDSPIQRRDQDERERENRHSPSRDIQLVLRTRRKKKKNRMFLGANGPVYFRSALDIPFA